MDDVYPITRRYYRFQLDVYKRQIQKVTPPARKKAPKLKRVAAYARVSSGREAPLHSLSAQISQYSGMIQKTPGWQYAGVYADEALTGTKDSRGEFSAASGRLQGRKNRHDNYEVGFPFCPQYSDNASHHPGASAHGGGRFL